ncbi:MAG: hypothetical protein ACJAXB_002207 [Candidatus Endobugula sp.]|jgi:hypothetical protein
MNKWKGPPHDEIQKCGAKTRSGGFCGHYSMRNGRCRYHGGKSTGAKNPRVKHGMYTKVAMKEARLVNKLIREANKVVVEVTG